jgi:hypothetical protein
MVREEVKKTSEKENKYVEKQRKTERKIQEGVIEG